jgi:hypothetical protein
LDFIRDGGIFLPELELLKSHPVDPARYPTTAVLVEAYRTRLEIIVAAKATKPKRGAPLARRSDTLAAYDMKKSQGLSLSQVTMKVCDCGEARHGANCQDRLRKRFHELEKLLEKYSLKIDSPRNERK